MFFETLFNNPQYFFAVVFTVVVSICIHELAHGAAAIWQGDRTPIETGHMTLNPAVHMGGMSLVMLAVVGIAWGKMPVDPSRMRGRYSGAMVAFAGPLSNVLMAAIALVSLGLIERTHTDGVGQTATNAMHLLWTFGLMNVALAIFNMIPIPPLDGARVFADLFPPFDELLGKLARGGQLGIAFLLLFFFAGPVIFKAAAAVANWTLLHVRGG